MKQYSRVLNYLLGGTAPENLTGELRSLQPTLIPIMDAADLGKAAVRSLGAMLLKCFNP